MSAPTDAHSTVVAKLSTLDRLLPLWIGVAMVAGLLLGRMIPGLGEALSAVELDGISLPIAIGLLVMMYRCWPRSATTDSTRSPATAGSLCPHCS